MTIGKLSGQCDFGQKGQSYCSQRGQSCVAKRVKVAWLFQLVRKQEIKGLAWFVDGEPRSDGQFIRLNPQEIVTIEVRKDDPKYPSGGIYGFTKTYVFDSFRKSLQSRFPSVYRRLQQEDCKTFGERFEVQVDGRKGDVWKQLSDLKESQLSSVELQKGSEGRELIRIKLKK